MDGWVGNEKVDFNYQKSFAMKNAYLTNWMKRLYFYLFFILLVSRTFAQCPTAPATCTFTVNANSATPYNVGANQTLCITAGTYTGSIAGIAQTGTIYVSPGATFNPSGINNNSGTIINCGTANLPGFNFAGDTVRIQNYNIMNLGTTGFNSWSRITNGIKAKMTFIGGVTLARTNITNRGSLKITGPLTTNGNEVNIFNEDSLTTDGNISLNGVITNTGYMFANGANMTLNANGTITNGCYFVSQGDFEYNGNSVNPLIVTGFIWARGANVKVNGSGILQLGSGGFVQGTNFLNDGTVRGTGDFRFTGDTKNQGTFGADGTAASHLNFYDATPPNATAIMDQGTAPHSSVTRLPLTARDNSTYVPGTCSIFFQCITQPNAGPDVPTCSTTVNLPDAVSTTGQRWLKLSGPSASITYKTGVVSGMNTAGTYVFVLADSLSPKCRDTVQVFKSITPPVPKFTTPRYVCQNTTVNLDSATYVWYAAASGGSPLSPAPIISTATPTTYTYYVSRNVGGCESARVRYDITVNVDPSVTLTVIGDTICSNATVDPDVTIKSPQVGVTYTARLGSATGTVLGSGTASSTADLVFLLNRALLAAAPSNNTIYFIASIAGCSNKTLSNTANVRVNSLPLVNLVVIGDTICSNATVNPDVTIKGPQVGVTYTARLGSATGTVLGSGTATTTADLTFPINRLLLAAATSNNTIFFTASINGCGIQTLSNTANVRVNSLPQINLAVVGDTICSNATVNPDVTVKGPQVGVTYTAHLGSATGTVLGSGTAATTADLVFPINRLLLAAAPSDNTIYFTSSINGCGLQTLTNTANVRVNALPPINIQVVGDTICSNATVNPDVTVKTPQVGVTYTAHLGSASGTILGSGTATSTTDLVFTVNRLLLAAAPSNNAVYFTASINGCGIQTLTNTANVRVNPLPLLNLAVIGDTICSNSTVNPNVTIKTPQVGVTYIAHLGSATGTVLGSATATATSDLVFQLNRALLAAATSNNTIYFTSFINGCGTQALTNTANVRVNSLPNSTALLSATTPICSGNSTTVSINPSEVGVTYSIYDGASTLLGTIAGNGATASKTFVLTTTGDHVLSARADIKGCATVTLSNTATVRVNSLPVGSFAVTASGPICAGGSSTISISGSEIGVKYKIYDGTSGSVLLDSIMGTGAAISKAVSLPIAGLRTIIVRAEIGGCAVITLVSQPTVQVNNGPNVGLAVSATSPICFGDTSRLRITNAQSGVTYQVFEVSTSLTTSVAGANADLTFDIIGLSVGTHTLTVKATTGGCGTVDLTQKPVVIVNGKPTDTNLILIGDTVCSNSDSASVTIFNTERGVGYQAILGTSTLIGSPKVSPSANATVVLRLPVAALALGTNIISIRGTIGGCGTINFAKTATVLKNKLPSIATLTLVGDTICQNTDSAYVRVGNTEVGVRYQSVIKGVPVGSIKTSTGNGSTVVLGIPRSALQLGVNGIRVSAKIGGCADATTTDSTIVIVNILPDANLAVVGDTVCSNSTFADFNIKNTKKGEIFQAYWKKVAIGLPKASPSDGANVVLAIPVATLGVGNHFITATASINGCATISLKDSALVIVNQLPGNNPTIGGDTICSDSVLARIRLTNTQAGVRYTAYKGSTPVGTGLATGTSLVISINATGFTTGANLLDLTASIAGCATVNITGKANVFVNPRPRYDLDFTATGPVCIGGLSTISIIGSEKNVIYTVLDNGVPIDTLLGIGGTVSKQVSMQNLGLRTITIKASINGCSEGMLNSSKTVQVNTGSDTKLDVTATSPVCEGNPIKVSIFNTDATATYKVVVNNVIVSDSLKGTGATIILTIDSLPARTYTLTIRANTLGCGIFELEKKPVVQVDPKLDANLKVGGDTVCSNNTNAFVSVEGTRTRQIYSAYLNGAFLNKDTARIDGRLVFSVPVSLLAKGPNKINFIASVAGCGSKALKDSALVVVNELPDLNLKVKGDTICRNSPSATVTVYQTKKGERYQVFLNSAALGKDTLSNGGTFVISVPSATLPLGLSKVTIRSTIDGCGVVQLKDSASILVNPIPDGGLSVSDDTVCVNSLTASINITGTKATEIYTAYLNGTPLDTVTSVGTQVTLTLPVSKLVIGLNKVSVTASIKGCTTVNLLDSAKVVVNELPSDTLKVIGDTVCAGADFVDVTVKGTRKGETYQAHEGNQALGTSVLSNGGDVILKVPVLGTLEKGLHKIWVSASIRGCSVVNLKDSADVLINDAPQPTLDVIGDTVCSNSTTASVRIIGTKVGEAYTALLNLVPVSDTVLSAGGTVTLFIPVSKLSLDTNIIQVRTSVPGCGNTLLAKSARVIVNQLPADSLKVIGDTVCSDAATATVKILKSSKNVVYTPYLGSTSLGQPVVGTGNDIDLTVSVSLLQEGINKVSFLASIDGCANLYLKDSASVIKNKKPSIALNLMGSTVCSNGDTATVTILGTEVGALYQAIINGGTNLGRSVRGTGSNVVLKLPVEDLSLDTNKVSVSVGIEGCGLQTLDNQALVIINRLPSDTLSTEGSTVCQSEPTATVTVHNTQKNVGYEAYLNNASVGSVIIGTGGTIELPVMVNKLALGDNKIVVKTSLEQCNVITLKDTAIVKVNKSPDVNAVIVEGSSICPSQIALVILSNTQSDVTYNLILNNQAATLSIKGTGGPDTIRVSSGLSAGINPVRFTASIQSCNVVDVIDTDTIFVLSDPGFSIIGSDLLCYNGIGKYKTTGVPGALGYVWTVQGDSGTVIPSLTSDSLKVQYDTRNGYIKVFPVGIYGKCDLDSATHTTLVKAPITGNVSISGKDTICINDTDTLRVVNQRGVGFYNWIFPTDVRILDTIGVYTDSTSNKILVRYTESGFRIIKAVPFSQCARTFGDTITKTVRVLGQPIPVANDVSSSDDIIRAITLNLNGVGSTETGIGIKDTVTYQWFVKSRPEEIANPFSLHNATITPTVEETKVYLTVTNVKGNCPLTDSAIVKVTFGLDIPNVFSPNNDGVHDKFEIRNLSILFPQAMVEVYNKWGSLVWKSQPGYKEAWDGTRNGEDLPVATYYFVLDKKDGTKPEVRPVTIIR